MSVISDIEKEQISSILGDKKIPHFGAGDTLKVAVKLLKEQEKEFKLLKGFVLEEGMQE